MEDFFTHHASGPLDFARVPALLAGLDGPDLLRAGRLLARLTPGDVPDARTCTIAVTGQGTLAPLIPALAGELARHGLLARTTVGQFGGYLTELADPASEIYAAKADLTLCVLDAQTVFDEVPVPWRPADVEAVFTAKLATLENLIGRFEKAGGGTLVLNTLPLPHRFTAQLVDHRSRAQLGAVWREATARLLRLGEEHPGVVVLDLDPLIAEGIAVDEPRFRSYAGLHLSEPLLARYAREIGHLGRGVAGTTKKVLVLDLDGTTWGGVLGEDGQDGVRVDGAFRDFQRVIKQIGSQGVLLAVASKNDAEPVARMLRDHEGMTLREDDFVRVTANWRPKHDNLTVLADDLNLGVDSFVFVDDSPGECGLVRRELPGVSVVQVDVEPALHVGKLLRDGWFDVRELTVEDGKRVTKYRDELVRKDFLDSFDSIEQYLKELEVRVVLAEADAQQVPRVSQLTLRTNQFNLTTTRLQQPQVQAMLDNPQWTVLTIASSDRFGDNGLVEVLFARRDGTTVHLDNFVLSCRVFSRGIEQACLSALLGRAKAEGATEVLAAYRPTAKNGKVAGLYPRYGFAEAGEGLFRHDLADIVEVPDHLHLEQR